MEWQLDHHLTMQELCSIFSRMYVQLIEDMTISSFSVAEETYRFATLSYGRCGKEYHSHIFWVVADKIGVEMRKNT